ncbi:MAG: hypothetical protein ABJA90_10995 [Ginsengibacter sp.]
MQHLENDMDDLFQRAAEKYPLQAGKGDWESIARRISDNADDTKVIPPPVSSVAKKVIALASLLFLVFTAWFIFYSSQTSKHAGTNKANLAKDNEIKSFSPDVITNTEEDASKQDVVDAKKDRVAGSLISVAHASKNNSANASRKTGNIFFKTNQNSGNQVEETAEGKKLNEKDNRADMFLPSLVRENTGKQLDEVSTVPEISVLNTILPNMTKLSLRNILGEADASQVIEKQKEKTPGISQKRKGFYMGFVAGPDFSKVESRSFSKGGFDAGILVGIRANKRISFESGLIWNKKIYNSEGKNFSMNKVRSTMPVGMVINNLSSKSSFVEIPIKVKYDLIMKHDGEFFISGGVSSYIMTVEKNSYNVTLNGIHEKFSGVYKRNNYAIPAVANISIGYEYGISRNVGIRVEPFLKIPLQGMGVGSLPVTSAGVQLGITSRLK